MYKRILIFGVVIIGLASALVRAQDNAAASATKNLTANIKGTVPSAVASPCATAGYAAFCPSPVACTCLTINGATVSGSLAGKGTANLLLTEETSLATSAVVGQTCTPFFGTADLSTSQGTGKKAVGKKETLNLQGVSCDNGQIAGGFGIAASPVPTPGATGFGIVTGTVKGSSLSLQLKGPITQ
jgi:hypothetical protein